MRLTAGQALLPPAPHQRRTQHPPTAKVCFPPRTPTPSALGRNDKVLEKMPLCDLCHATSRPTEPNNQPAGRGDAEGDAYERLSSEASPDAYSIMPAGPRVLKVTYSRSAIEDCAQLPTAFAEITILRGGPLGCQEPARLHSPNLSRSRRLAGQGRIPSAVDIPSRARSYLRW